MFKIHSKSFTVTEAMKESAVHHFQFLTDEELKGLRIQLEQLNAHTLRIKLIYQQPKQPVQRVELITKDFYKGIEASARKLKLSLCRFEEKRKSRQHKVALSQTFEEELAYQVEPVGEESIQAQCAKETHVPIYEFTLAEAVEQMMCFNYNVLMYQDVDEGALCTLVRQSETDIKRYIGVPS